MSKEKKFPSKMQTLSEVWEAYKLEPKRTDRTNAQYRSTIDRCILDWWNRPINSITREEIRDRHAYLSQANLARGEGRAQADLVMRILNALFNFAIRQYRLEGVHILLENPVLVLSDLKQWNKSESREENISNSQLSAFWQELEKHPNQNESDYLKLILLTGLSRTNIICLSWDQVDLRKGALLFDPLKPIPISTYALEILKRRHKSRGSSEESYVFPSSTNRLKHCSEYRGHHQIENKLKFQCSPMVLARTFQSVAIGLSISELMILALTNRKQKILKSAFPSFESMKRATELISSELLGNQRT